VKIPDLTGLPVRAIILSEKHEVWCLVSAWRYERLVRNNWNVSWGSRTRWQLYAKRNVGVERATIRMHRVIMQEIEPLPEDAAAGMHVDHGNGQTLDNRDENLSWATPAQNRANTRAREHIPSLELIVMRLRAELQRQPTRVLEDVPY
jgi:hypothetical protein